MMRATQARDHTVTVLSKEEITPSFIRVHLHSDTFFEDAELAPTAWLRGWFPDHEGKETEHQRGYTISSGDTETGRFSLDFVLHEPAGPASAWAQNCRPGDTLQVNTLGSSKFELPEERPAGYLLVGDAAAIPGLAGIITALPHDVPIELYLEEHHPDDRLIPIPSHPRLLTHWTPRTGPQSLAQAIEARDWSNWHVWATPESASLKQLRSRLRDDFGFPRSEIHSQAYWVEGKAMGKQRGGDGGGTASAPGTSTGSGAAAKEPALASTGSVNEASGSATGVPDPSPASTSSASATTNSASAITNSANEATNPVSETKSSANQAAGSPHETTNSPSAPPDQAAPVRGKWRASAGSRLLAPLKPVFVATAVLQAIVTLIELAPFFLLVELSRRLLSGDSTPRELWAIGIWTVVLVGLGALLGAALVLWLHAVDARFERELRSRLLAKLSRLPLGWFSARGSAQVKQVVQDDTLALHYLVTHAVGDAVAAAVAPVAVLVYLFVVDWRMALLMFVPVLVYVVTMYLMILRSYDTTPKALKWAERMQTEAGAYLEGQPVVRVFGGAAASTFRARLGEYVEFLDGWQRPFTGLKTFMDLATRPSTFLLLICVFGTLWVTSGAMDPLDLLPFLLLGTTFGSRLLGIGYGMSGLRDGLLAARRVQNVLEEQELAAPSGAGYGGSGSARPRGEVRFEGVGFAYRPGAPVLEDVSLTLQPGTVTALVGPSGSGKSTLAALLARFHDVGEGAIRIDGTDIRELDADELYARVGFVFQETQLVQGSVRENIALAAPDASDERVEAAARAANIHDRILRMPQGYDTRLGPDAALSGGERQRLTIARAILSDTPVLVLDEATAFADPESEFLVQQALGRLTRDRTVLVIAHRLHTIADVHRIVVLDHGRIAESGTHAELLGRDGRYRKLWDAGKSAAARGAGAGATADPEPAAVTTTTEQEAAR
ncbi:iron ABC transporter permease [Leucobacter sp. UCD-THU]|nr:iron ABC transporter permease [Leucobacter sp. UCD-THU]